MTKTLLILGASRQAEEGLRHLRECGWFLVGCDMDEHAPGFKWCDDHIIASVYHAEQAVPAALDYHQNVRSIDGVMCLAVDCPHVAARIAKELGLPSISVETADFAVDKIAMKDRFKSAGMATPVYQEVGGLTELQAFYEQRQKPLVVKPCDSRGSKGVSLIKDSGDLEWAFNHAKVSSPTGRVEAEEFLSGPQLSTETIVYQGKAYTIGISDRNYEFLDTYAPYIIENGGDLPSCWSEEELGQAKDVMGQAARALGVENGILKGDLLLHAGTVYVVEVALRLSGGYFCTHEVPLNTGRSTIIPVAKIALGEPLSLDELEVKELRPVYQRYIFPKPGRIVEVSGVDKARHLPGVEFIDLWAEIGDDVISPVNAGGSVGVIITSGKTREMAWHSMVAAQKAIEIKTV